MDWQYIQELANALGWQNISLLLFLLGIAVFFLQRNRISFLNNHVSFLKDQLAEAENFHPDRVVVRIQERLRIQNELVDDLERQLGVSHEELTKEKQKVASIELEIDDLATKLQEAYTALVGELPREGYFRSAVADSITDSVILNSEFALPLEIHNEPFKSIIQDEGQRQEIVLSEDAGMSKIHLALNIDGVFCGQIRRINQSPNVIGNDFITTITPFLGPFNIEDSEYGFGAYKLPKGSRVIQKGQFGEQFHWLVIPMTTAEVERNPNLKEYVENRVKNGGFY